MREDVFQAKTKVSKIAVCMMFITVPMDSNGTISVMESIQRAVASMKLNFPKECQEKKRKQWPLILLLMKLKIGFVCKINKACAQFNFESGCDCLLVNPDSVTHIKEQSQSHPLLISSLPYGKVVEQDSKFCNGEFTVEHISRAYI